MEFKGTKGKWELGGNTEDGILISALHPHNRDVATVWKYDNDFLENLEMQSNAKLIASAPEMFEELKETITDLKILRNQIDFESKSNHLFQGMPELMDRWIERKQQLLTKITSND